MVIMVVLVGVMGLVGCSVIVGFSCCSDDFDFCLESCGVLF